jgi:hypothetical protein
VPVLSEYYQLTYHSRVGLLLYGTS